MESVNPNIQSIMQPDSMSSLIHFNPSFAGGNVNRAVVNDAAFSFMPQMFGTSANFDMLMNNIAAFKDIISVAQGGISEMKAEGESIRDLVKQAQEEGVTPELLDKIQAEVDARIAQIQRIRDGADYNGINPFNGSFSLDIPNVLELMGKQDAEDPAKEISEMMASFDIDISIEGNGFSIGGSAKIEIGMTEDGALQINVDASMDYDLSGLLNNGVSSDSAFDMINNFINMLGVQQGDLGNAQNFLDAIVEQIFGAMNGAQDTSADGVEITPDSSNSLKGKMVQQASITLEGAANQMPNIAINIL